MPKAMIKLYVMILKKKNARIRYIVSPPNERNVYVYLETSTGGKRYHWPKPL